MEQGQEIITEIESEAICCVICGKKFFYENKFQIGQHLKYVSHNRVKNRVKFVTYYLIFYIILSAAKIQNHYTER